MAASQQLDEAGCRVRQEKHHAPTLVLSHVFLFIGTQLAQRVCAATQEQDGCGQQHANNEPLGPEWLDHPLTGEWDGHRGCHIGGDFLLAYKLDDSPKHGLVIFVRAGSHADLFS